jgi:hypothetical protein
MVFDPHAFDLDGMYACCVRLLEDAVAVKAALRHGLPEVLALAHVNFAATPAH